MSAAGQEGLDLFSPDFVDNLDSFLEASGFASPAAPPSAPAARPSASDEAPAVANAVRIITDAAASAASVAVMPSLPGPPRLLAPLTGAENERVFAALITALGKYPAPMAVRAESGSVTYAPVIPAAAELYVAKFQRVEGALDHFAAVVPKILARYQGLARRAVNAIADGQEYPEARAEYNALLADLSTLATMFAPIPGVESPPFAAEYYTVCDALTELQSTADALRITSPRAPL